MTYVLGKTWEARIADGEFGDDATLMEKFAGRVTTGTNEQDIWCGPAAVAGNDLLNFQVAAFTIEAISTSVNDTAAGSGTRKITVEGHDINMASISAELTMNGTTVTTASTEEFFRIHRAYDSEQGTYYDGTSLTAGSNNGNITIRKSSAGATQALIPAYFGQTVGSHFTTPANTICLLTRVMLTMDSNKTTDFFLKTRRQVDVVSAPVEAVRTIKYWYGVKEPVEFQYEPVPLPEKTDIWMSCISAASGTIISAEYDLIVQTKP